jgi:hypothetical protein
MIDEYWMGKELKLTGGDLTDEFCYGIEECPGRDSNLATSEFKSQTLRLRQSTQSNK